MDLGKISYSSLNTFLMCQKKFIVDKTVKQAKLDLHSNSLPLAFGSYFHFVMEIYFKLFSDAYSVDELLENSFKSDAYVEQFKTKINIDKEDLIAMKHSLHKDQSKENIKKHLQFLAEEHFINFTISDKTSVLKYYDQCVKMLHDMVDDPRRKWFDIKPSQVVAVEHYFDVITNSGAPIHGFIDLILSLDDGYYFIDWKSGQVPMTKQDIIDSLQLDFYNCGTMNELNDKPRYFVIDMCRLGYFVPVLKYVTDAQRIDKFLGSTWDKWQNLDEDKVEPTICEVCSWCDIKFTCPAIEKATEIGLLTSAHLQETPTGELAEQFLKISDRAKVFTNMKKEIQAIIEGRIMNDGQVGQPIEENGITIEVKQYQSVTLVPDEIKPHLSMKKAIEAGVISVGITKLKEEIGEENLDEIKKTAQNVSVTKRLFVKRRKKVG